MYVISESEQRTTRTPAGVMHGLAAPGQGGAELSTWGVELGADAATPVHVIDPGAGVDAALGLVRGRGGQQERRGPVRARPWCCPQARCGG